MASLGRDGGHSGSVEVLFLDDNPEVVALAATVLDRDPDIDVATETDPESALARVTRESFDCLVSDYRMPGMDGLTVCQQAQARVEIPCVLFTSADDQDIARTARDEGFELVYKHGGTEQYERLIEAVRDLAARG